MNNDTKRILKAVRKAGWRVQDTTDGWALYSPNGVDIVVIHGHGHGFDTRRMKNVLADLKRAGLTI